MTAQPRKPEKRSDDRMDEREEKGRITYDRCSACGKKFKNGEGRYVRLDREFCVTCYDAAAPRNRK